MKQIVTTAIILLGALTPTLAQIESKPIYKLESISYYDENGNLYMVEKYLDHLPTHEDSIAFKIASDKEVRSMMDSTRKALAPKPRKKTYLKKSN